ncbi:MAG TPA: beta-L-arabinofuranosidase domain-containing protein [Gemmatimonadales bacterium]|nr:beta-L-arabinofuranosidase domain-containing protein [Gemmatimonadales bacterium]
MKRRDFVASTAAFAALPLRRRFSLRRSGDDGAVRIIARPFDLERVRLRPGPFLDALQVNRRFLLAQDPDRLLHMFRVTAGLPSNAQPLGGWEAPENELRGHYPGHYLSALARMSATLRDAELRARGDRLVAALAACQERLGNGYLSAFPEEFFDRLRDGTPVWAPFYTLHKIMAGLLDMHVLGGNAQALDVLKGMARWTGRWAQPLGDEHMARVLEREYGGMNELLYNLSAVTGDASYSRLAHRFDHERFFAPLALGRDELKGLHANTNIPKVIGAARRYELTGEPRDRRIAEYFWREVTTERAYCTGGTSNGEGWNTDPGVLSSELSGYTQEDCTTYNMLKLTRHVFGWTADSVCADYYERALFNGILGSQHPRDGEKLYYVNLAAGLWKLFGTPGQDYWCCTGTMSEAFSQLGDGIYFHDDSGVYVNLFIASELDWAERGVRLVQETRFPEAEGTTLRVQTAKPLRFALRVRVPHWATRGGMATLNGHVLDGFAGPGGYYVLDRTWRTGDTVGITLPMTLHLCAMPDDTTLQAVMYGPLVLVGRLGTEGLTPDVLRAEPTKPRAVPQYKAEPIPAPELRAHDPDPNAWIKRAPGGILEFRTVGQSRDVSLVPLHTIFDERYAVYWRVTAT